MSEIKRIIDQFERAFSGDAWHGPSVEKILSEVTADQAAAKPLPGAHSIWELALHITAWERVVLRRLEGEIIIEIPDAENFPHIGDTGEESWQRTLHEMRAGHSKLGEAISRFDESRLDAIVPGKDYSYYVMFHGVIQHDLYHAGQIAMLKKSQA